MPRGRYYYKKRGNNRHNETPKQAPPVKPAKPIYSDIVRRAKALTPDTNTKHVEPDKSLTYDGETGYPVYHRDNSYERWEYGHFAILLRMREIIMEKILSDFPEAEEYITSKEFFGEFCRLLYDKSPKNFVYADETDEETTDFYMEYKDTRDFTNEP